MVMAATILPEAISLIHMGPEMVDCVMQCNWKQGGQIMSFMITEPNCNYAPDFYIERERERDFLYRGPVNDDVKSSGKTPSKVPTRVAPSARYCVDGGGRKRKF